MREMDLYVEVYGSGNKNNVSIETLYGSGLMCYATN